jgi:hypothetical protein
MDAISSSALVLGRVGLVALAELVKLSLLIRQKLHSRLGRLDSGRSGWTCHFHLRVAGFGFAVIVCKGRRISSKALYISFDLDHVVWALVGIMLLFSVSSLAGFRW